MLPNWLYGKSLKKLQEILNSGGQTAAGVSYSNTESGLEATNAQAAIDEVVEELDTKAAQSALTTLSDTVTTLTGTVNGKVSWSDYAQSGAVNLLPNTATTQTISGITFTVNSDGSVTVSGTATANAELSLYTNTDGSPYLVGKTLKLSGCPSGGGDSTYKLQAYRVESADGSGGTVSDSGDGAEITWLNNGSGTKAIVKIVIFNGYAITDSITFYPMIAPVNYTCVTYLSNVTSP